MRFSSRSLPLALLISALTLSGCASKQPERRFTMPSWVDGYNVNASEEDAESEQDDATQEESASYAPESAADASDRISREPAEPVSEPAITDAAQTAAVDSEPVTTERSPESAVADSGSGETAPDADKDTPAAEPEVKLPPRPAPLIARNEQQALEAQQAAPRFQTALQKMQSGDLASALILFQGLTAQFPSLTGPIVNQAIILRKQKNYQQAKTVLQSALLNKAQNPYLMNELGLVHRQLGNFDAAKQAYLAAIRLEPNYDKAHYNLAVLADLYLHDPALAFQHFEMYQSLQIEPDKKVAGWLKEIQRRIP